jgi:1-phosphofructokinase family hexose kinase
MKINAILLNPTIDMIYEIEDFYVGGTFKVNKKEIFPVGKAISFSLAARELDKKIRLKVVAFIGKDEINIYERFLRSKDIEFHFIKIDGKTRSNKTINDPINHTTTHIREPGFQLNKSKIKKMKDVLERKIEKEDMCIFSGSIPPNTDAHIYKELIQLSKKKGAKCALDSSGEALINGIKAHPHIIKPNLIELSQILDLEDLKSLKFKDPVKDCRKIIKNIKPLLKEKIEIILITLGAKGAIIAASNYISYGKIEIKNVVDSVGSGDSFLAGFLIKYNQDKSLEECFENALASGAANTQKYGPGIFNSDLVNQLMNRIELIKID